MGTVTGSTFGASEAGVAQETTYPALFTFNFLKRVMACVLMVQKFYFFEAGYFLKRVTFLTCTCREQGSPLSEDMGNSMHSIKASTQTSGRKESWSWGFRGATQTAPNSSNLVASFAVNSEKSSHEYNRAISDSQRSSMMDNICLMSFTATNSKTYQKTNETFYGFFWWPSDSNPLMT